MKRERYLLDTHALVFWSMKQFLSEDFIDFIDRQANVGNVLVSSVSFWEVALLSKRKMITIHDIREWKTGLMEKARITLIDPDASEMIESANLPDFHDDLFDRLLIIQAFRNKAALVTKDPVFEEYPVETFWIQDGVA